MPPARDRSGRARVDVVCWREATMTGYGGRTLHVDLTSGRSEVRPLDERTARAFVGGNGLAARLLWEAAVPGADAFDPATAVALAVGPVTDRKSTRLNSSHLGISYAVFCLKK